MVRGEEAGVEREGGKGERRPERRREGQKAIRERRKGKKKRGRRIVHNGQP